MPCSSHLVEKYKILFHELDHNLEGFIYVPYIMPKKVLTPYFCLKNGRGSTNMDGKLISVSTAFIKTISKVSPNNNLVCSFGKLTATIIKIWDSKIVSS